MPRRPNPFRRIIQWVRRRTSLSEEEAHRPLEERVSEQQLSEERLGEQQLSEERLGEHELSEERLAAHNLLQQRLLEQELLERRILEQRIREQRPPRRAGGPERRHRVRVLYTNRWTESEQDLAQLATEGRHETHRPGEPIIYRVQILERPEAIANIRRSLTMTIEENGLLFRFDLLETYDEELNWAMQILPQE